MNTKKQPKRHVINTNSNDIDTLRKQLSKMAEEYQKIKEKNKVLKAGVREEQRRNQELTSELQTCKKDLRTQTAELDSQGFHVQRLTKRVDKLKEQLELAQAEAKQNGASVGWMGSILGATTATTGTNEKFEEKFKVLRNELQLKIEENERVHMQMFQVQSDHANIVAQLKKDIEALKGRVADTNDQLQESKQARDELSREKEHQDTLAKRKIQELILELSKTRKEMASRETTIMSSNQTLAMELNDMKELYASKVNFDDTYDTRVTMLNLPNFNRDIILRKCKLLDSVNVYIQDMKNHMVFILDTLSIDYSGKKVCDPLMQLWDEFVKELTELRQIFRNLSQSHHNHNHNAHNKCIIVLTKIVACISDIITNVVTEYAKINKNSPLIDHLNEIIRVVNGILKALKDREHMYISFYCDWNLDYLLMGASSAFNDLSDCCSKIILDIEYISENHRKTMTHGIEELRNVFDNIHKALQQYGQIRISSSSSTTSVAMTSTNEPLDIDDVSNSLILLPHVDIDDDSNNVISCLRTFYNTSSAYLTVLNSIDDEISVPYNDAIEIHDKIETIGKEIQALQQQHDVDKTNINQLNEQCTKLKNEVCVLQSDKEALESLSQEYNAAIINLEHELEEAKQSSVASSSSLINHTNGGGGDDDDDVKNNAPIIVTIDSDEKNQQQSCLSSPKRGRSSSNNTIRLLSSNNSPYRHPRSVDRTMNDCNNAFIIKGVSELIYTKNHNDLRPHVKLQQQQSSLSPSLSNRHLRSTYDGVHHTNMDNTKLKALRHQVAIADKRAVKFHSELQYLNRVLLNVFQQHIEAKEDAKQSKKLSERLTSDMHSTKENYEKMMHELTEHVCKLTEQLAINDAKM